MDSGFRGVREVHLGRHEALTQVRLPQGLSDARYAMHPAFLDACLHAYFLVLDGAETGDAGHSYLPVSLAGFRCHQDGIDTAWVHTRLRSVENDTQVIDIGIYDLAGRPVAELDGLATASVAARDNRAGSGRQTAVLSRRLAPERRTGSSAAGRTAPQAGSSSPMQTVSAHRSPASWRPSVIIATWSTGRMPSRSRAREPGPSTSATPRIFADCWRNSPPPRRCPARASSTCGGWTHRRSRA